MAFYRVTCWPFIVAILLILGVAVGLAEESASKMKKDGAERMNPNSLCITHIQKGGFMYRAYCASCHGLDAMGGGPEGAGFDPPAGDLLSRESGYTDQRLAEIIEKGRREMPGWKNTLSDEAIWAIVSWLRTR